ncbi:MAG: GNAT family N-acetyltransferase [Firmicutes bacterium]|nr:GNAT family N-acetyltransferase [Bacillota bacterium]
MLGNLSAETTARSVPRSAGQPVRVRKATRADIHDIVRVACSVGNSVKDPKLGFLITNYAADPLGFLEDIAAGMADTDFFYVAEGRRVCGFLMAYDRERWLQHNPSWLSQIHWHPEFDAADIERFVVVEKTAVMAGMTGQGIGSLLYERLLNDLRLHGVENMLAETVIAPSPNFASLEFRRKQNYQLAGIRYERIDGTTYTSLVYRKKVTRALR